MILNLKSSRVQKRQFIHVQHTTADTPRYQLPVHDAYKLTGKHSFHCFHCAGKVFLSKTTQLVISRCHLHHLHPEKILPDWMHWLRQQRAVPVELLVASVAIPAVPVLLAVV